jgi:hypothetical protein
MVLNLLERGRLDRLLRDQAPEVKEAGEDVGNFRMISGIFL